MHTTKAARRYADALLQLTEEVKKTDQVRKDLKEIHMVIEQSKDLRNMLLSPIIKSHDKRAVLKSMFDGKVDDLTVSFIDLITLKQREKILIDILNAFEDSYNTLNQIKKAEVVSAFELSDQEKKDLVQSLQKRTESTIVADYKVDASLVGGLKVQILDTIYDGTIRHKLDRLETLFSTPL